MRPVKLQRRHFALIAGALQQELDSTRDDLFQYSAVLAVCHTMADTLASTNVHFNRARFLSACGADTKST